MSDVSVTVGGGTGVTVAVNGNTTTATVTAGGSVQVTLTDTSPPTWSGITGKPTTFPPQDHNHFIGDTVGLQAALDEKADLDSGGKVPASQLLSYVDDVLEVANAAALPATGETGKIYVTLDNGKVFRWGGSVYVEISAAPGSTDYVPEGTTNLYHTTARAAAAAPVQSVAGKTGTVTLVPGDVGAAASSHAHGSITNDGKIGTDAGFIVVTGTGGTLSAAERIRGDSVCSLAGGVYLDAGPTGYETTVTDALQVLDSAIDGIAYNLKPLATSGSASDLTSGTVPIARIPTGSTSSTVCLGSDARLSDARTPTDGSVTDAKIASSGLSTASLNWAAIAAWAPSTSYAKGALVEYLGIAYRRSVAGTSGATFNTANWQQITPTSFVASQIASGTISSARLGSGTADSTTFLRGDSTFATPPVTSVDGATGAVTITKATVYEFTRTSAPSGVTGSAGVWSGFSLPSNAKFVEFLVVAAGGGGGSGRRGAAGTARFGGGGGGGGGVIHTTVPASFIATTISVQIGSGGAGGAARTTDDTDGNSGSAGTYSSISFNSYSNLLISYAGLGGGGGTATAGSGGSSGGTANNRTWLGIAGSSTSATGVPNRAFPTGNVPQGGSAGGGISTGNVAYAGAGQYAYSTLLYQSAQLGSDVSGGAASTSAAATAGANGVSYGYGGCGGGASANGNNSGAGGNGGDGYVRITVWS